MLLVGGLSKARVLDAVAMLLLLGIAIYGVQRWMAIRDARQTQEAMLVAAPAVGRPVDALVVSDEEGTVQRLSDVGAGECRYIIIGTRTCPYARTAAFRWLSTARNDPDGGRMPDGWQAFWVVADETTGRGDLFDPAFPSPTFYVRDQVAFIRAAGVSHSPLHLVMDRSGIVVDAGSERRLLPKSVFLDNCTIAAGSVPSVLEAVTPVTPTEK